MMPAFLFSNKMQTSQSPKIIIAIDGYSSSGKSSMAKALAKIIGYNYVDTGAMYRAVTLYAMQHGMIDGDGNVDADAIVAALPRYAYCIQPHARRFAAHHA